VKSLPIANCQFEETGGSLSWRLAIKNRQWAINNPEHPQHGIPPQAIRNTAIRNTAIRNTAIRNTPIRNTAIRHQRSANWQSAIANRQFQQFHSISNPLIVFFAAVCTR
jgi:hypothetical protein